MDAFTYLIKKQHFGIVLFSVFLVFVSYLDTKSLSVRTYPLSELSTTSIKINKKTLKLWVMDTGVKRQEGMMHLLPNDIPKNHGMLFVFSSPERLAFWMKNTFIPLDLIFLDKNKKILNLERLNPHDLTPVYSNGFALYAIELSVGLIDKNKLVSVKHLQFSLNFK